MKTFLKFFLSISGYILITATLMTNLNGLDKSVLVILGLIAICLGTFVLNYKSNTKDILN